MRPDFPPPTPPPPDDDQSAWLVTFSDLVLQLFAFVIVAVVLGRHAPIATAAITPAAIPQAPATRGTGPARRPTIVEPPVVAETVPNQPEGEEPTADDPPTAIGVARPTTPAPLAAARAELTEFLRTSDRPDAVELTVQSQALVVTMGEAISFGSARAQLLDTATPVLDELTRLAARLPSYAIEIAGHTDDTPIHGGAFTSNLDLSLARAAAVAHAITAHDPRLGTRVVAAGFGDRRPLAANTDAAGRARNRRVELRFVPIDPAHP